MKSTLIISLLLFSLIASANTEESVKQVLSSYCESAIDLFNDYAESANKSLESEKNIYKSLCTKSKYKPRSKSKYPESLIVDMYAVVDTWDTLQMSFGSLNTPDNEGLRTIFVINRNLINSAAAGLMNDIQIQQEIGAKIPTLQEPRNAVLIIRIYMDQAKSENQKIRSRLASI